MVCSEFRKLLSNGLELIPVGPGLPGRINGRVERMDKGMQICGTEIVHLIPGRCRQSHIRVHGTGGHSEFQGDQEIQLAFGSRISTLYLLRLFLTLFVENRIVGSQEMFEEIFVPLAAGAQKVCPPKKKNSRPIFWTVRILEGELNFTLL